MSSAANTEDRVRPCGECGASVYQTHLDTGLAGFMGGKLLCVHCFKEKKAASRSTQETPTPSALVGHGDELPSIPLDEAFEASEEPAAQRTAHGMSGTTTAPALPETPTHYRRPLNKNGTGATRCRTFHCKLSDEGVRHMDEQVNEWCDANPDVEIKYSTSTVGVWIGKHAEPNLIVTIFY